MSSQHNNTLFEENNKMIDKITFFTETIIPLRELAVCAFEATTIYTYINDVHEFINIPPTDIPTPTLYTFLNGHKNKDRNGVNNVLKHFFSRPRRVDYDYLYNNLILSSNKQNFCKKIANNEDIYKFCYYYFYELELIYNNIAETTKLYKATKKADYLETHVNRKSIVELEGEAGFLVSYIKKLHPSTFDEEKLANIISNSKLYLHDEINLPKSDVKLDIEKDPYFIFEGNLSNTKKEQLAEYIVHYINKDEGSKKSKDRKKAAVTEALIMARLYYQLDIKTEKTSVSITINKEIKTIDITKIKGRIISQLYKDLCTFLELNGATDLVKRDPNGKFIGYEGYNNEIAKKKVKIKNKETYRLEHESDYKFYVKINQLNKEVQNLIEHFNEL